MEILLFGLGNEVYEMTKDQITRLAKEAGIYHGFDSEGHWDGLLDFQLIERRPLSKESIMYGENRMFEILEDRKSTRLNSSH